MMWNPNSIDKLARQFQETNDLKDHQDTKASIKDELNTPSRYGKKEAWSEGGMKQIYQIYDHSTGRHLAMAELKPDLEQDYSEPFLREARLTATLDHPNIISIHEIGLHDDGNPYFTMDFLDNRTLEQLFYEHREKSKNQDRQQLLFERLDIFLKICDAISYAHSRGIVHLDIKLSNVHIGLYGEVWVCDWGLGKSLEEPEVLSITPEKTTPQNELQEIWTRQYGIKGTPGSIAPEQIRGYEKANKKSDIYSLGCLLYELVLLEKPFSGSEDEVLDKIQKGEWDFKTQYLPFLPNSLKAVISKAMALAEEDRYSDVNELKKEIELYMGGHSTKAQDASLWTEIYLFIHRHKWPSFIALGLTIIIILLTGTFIVKLKESTQAAQLAAQQAQEQKQLANELRVKAEYVAEQYLNEKKNLEIHQTQARNNDHTYHNILLNSLIFKESQKSVELALERLNSVSYDDPHYHWAQDRLVYTYFLKQDFPKAVQAYKNLTDKDDIDIEKDLYEVSLIYQDKLSDEQLLSLQDFSGMLRDLKERRTMLRTHLVEKMLNYIYEIKGKADYFDVVKAILEHWHEDWDGKGIVLNPKTQTLRITSPDLKIFTYINISSDRCILRFLDFDHLVLSGSGVYDLSHFDDLSLYSLDLTNTQLNSILALNQFKNIDRVKISKNQFPKDQLKKLNANIKIIVQ